MTDISESIKLIALAATAFVSFFCCLLMVINHFDTSEEGQGKKISIVATGMFFCSAFVWLSLLFYILHPRVFVYIHPATYLAMLYYEVLLYWCVYRITRTKADERFGRLHFIIPLLITGVIFVRAFSVPFDIQLAIIESQGEVYGKYKLYAMLLTSKSLAFFVYNIIYSLLSLRRIRQYQKAIVDYSADEGHSPVRWLYWLFFISLGTLPIIMLGSFLGKNPLFYTIALLFPLLMAALQYILICYNVIVVNFKLIEPEKIVATNNSSAEKSLLNGKIDKEKFELYIRQKKPYLKPDLRIMDMAAELLTNRTYLSGFINQEYGMNFCRYINHLRLKELAKLQVNPEYADHDILDIVQQAGFSSYRGYTRTKSEEERETVAKAG